MIDEKVFYSDALFFFVFGLSACGPEENIPSSDSTQSDLPTNVSERHYVGFTDQKNNRIVVYDLDVEDWSSEEALVWEFKGHFVAGAGFKFRSSEFWGGDVVIACGSGVGIIDFATKDILWSTSFVPNNPHSVELLPNGNIVCAGSTGNTIRIYGSSQKKSNCSSFDVEFADAHGLLWDPELEVLWAIGLNQLSAFAVGGTDAEPELYLIENMTYRLPSSGGHDLTPVYGDTDRLWCTTNTRVYQFVKSTGKFVTDFVGGSTLDRAAVKGIGNFYDKRVVYVFPNENLYEWTTDRVNYFDVSENGKRVCASGYRENVSDAYYKVRVWISDYQ